MKRLYVLLLVCGMLWGCAPRASSPETVPASTEAAVPSETAAVELYDPENPLEAATNGAVKTYSLRGMDATGIYPMEGGLLLTADTIDGTHLHKLTGEEGRIAGSFATGMLLSPGKDCLQLSGGRPVVYDAANRQLLILGAQLQELRQLSLPEDLTGMPLLSRDGKAFYYCTSDAVRALETDTGISRVLKEISFPCQAVTSLLFSDALLGCSIREENGRERTLFLSTENGRLLRETEGWIQPETAEDRYCAEVYREGMPRQLFGGRDGEVQVLNHTADLCRFFPEENLAVTATITEEGIRLDCYDLATGRIPSRLTLPGDSLPTAVTMTEGKVWILIKDASVLYRWDPALTPVQDDTCHTDSYYTRSRPDTEGLERCRQYTAVLSEKFGLEILIFPEESFPAPENCILESEYLVPELLEFLALLEQQLGNYPQDFLHTLSGYFSGIRIALVRSITDGGNNSLAGLQYWQGNTACILLAVDSGSTALYHELCHLTETVVLTKSNAYDRWDNLNPKGFRYLQNRSTPVPEEYQTYLQPDSRIFTDESAMISAAEDRARIMEAAMAPNQEETFRSLAMQSKLLQLCKGIRAAFGLKKSPETFLWEQYLNAPLAYTP